MVDADVFIILLSISSIVITTVNVLCVFIISKSTKLRSKPPTTLITNLIGTHMIQGILVIPAYALALAKLENTLLNQIMCNIYRFTYMLTFYSAIINVLLLSLDRLLAVTLLNRYNKIVTKKRVTQVTIASWLYILMLVLLPFVPFEGSQALENSKCHYHRPRVWTICMLIVNGLLPYVIVIISYVKVHRKIKSLSKYFEDINQQSQSNLSKQELKQQRREQKRMKYRQKVTKLTFIIVLSYGISWSPSIIYYTIQHLFPTIFPDNYYGTTTERWLSFIMKYINFFDAIGAPIIYCYFHDEFRTEFQRILCNKQIVTSNISYTHSPENNNDDTYSKMQYSGEAPKPIEELELNIIRDFNSCKNQGIDEPINF